MNIRPKLKIGDVVKLSKKGKTYYREFPMRSTLVVSKIVAGDGASKDSVIMCRTKAKDEFRFYKFFRSELWYVGKNVFNL